MAQKRVIKDVSTTGKISREKINSVVGGVHVVPENGSWAVKKTGQVRITEHFASKEAAVTFAKNISKNKEVAVIVHSTDGSVRKPVKVYRAVSANKDFTKVPVKALGKAPNSKMSKK